MVYIIRKPTHRDIERRIEQAPARYRGHISGFARDPEEAFRIQRERGYDDPSQKPLLSETSEPVDRAVQVKAGVDPNTMARRKR